MSYSGLVVLFVVSWVKTPRFFHVQLNLHAAMQELACMLPVNYHTQVPGGTLASAVRAFGLHGPCRSNYVALCTKRHNRVKYINEKTKRRVNLYLGLATLGSKSSKTGIDMPPYCHMQLCFMYGADLAEPLKFQLQMLWQSRTNMEHWG